MQETVSDVAASDSALVAHVVIMLGFTVGFALTVGIPLMCLVVAAWVALSRLLPSMERSARGVLTATGALALAAGILMLMVQATESSSGLVLDRRTISAALLTMVAVWGGLVAPRVVLPVLRPGALGWTTDG